MKKFKFTLQALFNYKLTVEKVQLGELRRAQQALRELLDEKQRLQQAMIGNERSLANALRRRLNVVQALKQHDAYFKYLRDCLIELEPRIIEAKELRDRCRDKLIVTMKEIKTLRKLHDEQYQAYVKEVQAEESKEIGDLVSFNVIAEG